VSTDTTPQAELAGLLQMYVQEDEEGTASAHVPVRWCVTPALIEACQQHNFKKPTLALAVRTRRSEYLPGDHSEEQWTQTATQFVRLDAEMTYVTFTQPGDYEIRATVVDIHDKSAAKTLSTCGDLFNQDGTSRLDLVGVPTIEEAVAYESVVVPSEMFAKEPPAWLKRIVGVFYEKPARDQCQFRRRVLATFGFAIPLMLTLGMAFRILVGVVGLVLGLRKYRWKGLRPFQDTLPLGDSSIWYTDEFGSADPVRFPLWFLNPFTLTVLPTIVFGIMHVRKHHGTSQATYQLNTMGWWHVVAWVDGSLVALVVAIAAIAGIIALISTLVSAVTHSDSLVKRRRNARLRRQQEEAAATRRIYTALSAMTCTTASSDVRVSALPSKKRTVRLRYNEAKAAVCKPFAR
jgi:hypothetical protein